MNFLPNDFTEFKAEIASDFRELWKKEGEQDARLNTVVRKHEGLDRNGLLNLLEGRGSRMIVFSQEPRNIR